MGIPLPRHLYPPYSNISAYSPAESRISQSQDGSAPISNLETFETFGGKLYRATKHVLARYPNCTQIPSTKAIISVRLQKVDTHRMNRSYLCHFATGHNDEVGERLGMDVLAVFPGSRIDLALFTIPYEVSLELVQDCCSYRIIDVVERENGFSVEDWYWASMGCETARTEVCDYALVSVGWYTFFQGSRVQLDWV